MRKLNIGRDYKNVFFIGIGGIHMSGMARILKTAGYNVSGSDKNRSKTTDELVEAGINVFVGHDASHITKEIDLVIFTAAVPPENPEFVQALEIGVEIAERAKILGLIMKNFERPICISGTHGKTTTTSMITEIFNGSGRDSTAIIGGVLPSIGGSLQIGDGSCFIAESCEYYDAFLQFFPYVGVILNVDFDHSDYFGTLERMRQSFKKFAARIDENGWLVVFNGIDNLQEITDGIKCGIITYGMENADYTAEKIEYDELGRASFDVYFKGSFYERIAMSVPGEHNVLNALAAIAASRAADEFSEEEIKKGMALYRGTNRRFELKGKLKNGAVIYDSYSHHPTEIRADLSAYLKMEKDRLWCVFQPHTKKRTYEFVEDFAKCFNMADIVIILDIYVPVGREETDCEITSCQLLDKIKQNGHENAFYFQSFEEAEKFILKNIFPHDLLVTMGAGDIVFLGESMLLKDEA